jgi:hypothetical protein
MSPPLSLFCYESTPVPTTWRRGFARLTFLRKERKERTPDSIPEADRPTIRAHPEAPRDLLCATCRARITHDDHRIEVGGAHEHTFVNPGGFVHRVGCFGVATHLGEVGVPQTEFAWFPGFSWQIVMCRTCGTHLGWIFRCGADRFHGLLLEQLVSRATGDNS